MDPPLLVVNLVRTVPSLTTLIVSPFSLYLWLVILSIFRRPKRDLYEHFFWQLTLGL